VDTISRLPTRRAGPARAAAWAVVLGAAAAAAQPPVSRGKLLYDTHCITCHNSQMHWRDKRVVRDWPGLVIQVRAWQERATLGWTEADIVEVARHLNDTIYQLPRPVADADAGRTGARAVR
jgi:hypothetical protein